MATSIEHDALSELNVAARGHSLLEGTASEAAPAQHSTAPALLAYMWEG